MRLKELVVAFSTAAALGSSGYALALGLGSIKLKSKLHQPLNAEIQLVDVKDFSPTEILASLASQQDFARAGIQRPFSLTHLKFRTELRGDGTGIIYIRTTKPVQEPFLNFLLEVHWPKGRLLREYTFLMDLPTYSKYPAAPVQPPESRPKGYYPGSGQVTSPVAVGKKHQSDAVDPAAPQYSAIPKIPQKNVGHLKSYRVRPSDTLWKVARDARPERGISVQQTMLAIQQLNPQAFDDNNINKLKKGVVLRLPDRTMVESITFDQALWEVARQNREWQQRRRGGQLPQLDARRRNSIDTPAKARVTRGKLSIVSLENESGSKGKDLGEAGSAKAPLNDELIETREKLDMLTRENNELKSRLKDLDEQVATLKRLMMLKDDQMAALQASGNVQIDEKPEDSVVPMIPASKTVLEKAEKNAVGEPAIEINEPGVKSKQRLMEKEAVPSKPQEPAEVVQSQSSVIPEPPSPPEPGFFTSLLGSPLFLILAALIPLAGAGGYIYYRRRQEEQLLADEDELMEVLDLDSSPDTEEIAEDGDLAHEGLPDLDIDDDLEIDDHLDIDDESPEEISPEQTADAINEADVYIAYGRFEQAEALLNKAIANEPDRADLQLKRLEVYAESGDIDHFRQALVSLEVLGDQDALKVAETFKTRFSQEVLAEEPSAGTDTQSVNTASEEWDEYDLDFDEEEPEALSDGLDNFDLESGGSGQESPEEPVLESDAQKDGFNREEESEHQGLEFDMTADNTLEAPGLAGEESVSTETDDGNSLEFDTEGLDFQGASEDQEPETLGDDIPGLDFDMADLDGAGEPPASEGFTGDEQEAPEALPDIDLDDLQGEKKPSAPETEAGLDQLTPDMEFGDDLDEDLDLFSDEDEVSIKLDLARAYIDMGDREGASDILDEILEQGSDEQQEEAKQLLDQL